MLLLLSWLAVPAGQADAQLTESDYARAERFLSWNARTLVYGDAVSPNWIDGDRFWYRNRVRPGHEFVLVDPTRAVRALRSTMCGSRRRSLLRLTRP